MGNLLAILRLNSYPSVPAGILKRKKNSLISQKQTFSCMEPKHSNGTNIKIKIHTYASPLHSTGLYQA